ncbi:MAG: hypothetical protein ACYTBJ_15950 [Planctomycetota bacterium]|jgi:hypothetical protein
MGLRLPGWLGFEAQRKWERLRDRAARLKIRRWINEHSKVVVAVTCVSVALLAVIAAVYLWPERVRKIEPSDKAWFYDLNTGELFVAAKDLTPPIEAPSGAMPNGKPAGVKAYVLSYASEPNEENCFIGFLERADPDAKKDAAESGGDGGKRWGQGQLICRLADRQWVPADSRQGRAIVEEAFLPDENGERPYYVRPDRKIKN